MDVSTVTGHLTPYTTPPSEGAFLFPTDVSSKTVGYKIHFSDVTEQKRGG